MLDIIRFQELSPHSFNSVPKNDINFDKTVVVLNFFLRLYRPKSRIHIEFLSATCIYSMKVDWGRECRFCKNKM